jgi:serine/threonine protein kinase
MSPEQLKGAGVDHRTDVYALGVMSFEILARERPRRYSNGTFELDGLTISQALVQRHAVPQQLADLTEAMVANSADDRPTLEAVRTVIKRVRTSAATDPVRAVGTAAAPSTMSPSLVGARPVVQTPLSGTPTVQVGRDVPSDAPISLPPALEAPAYPDEPAQQAPYTSQPPHYVSQQPPYTSQPPHYVSQPPAYVSPPTSGSVTTPALAKASVHPLTKLGVPPPPRPSNRQPVAAARRSNAQLWVFVAVALVIVSGVALVIVLAT